jgi:hypothetical protein
MVRSLEEEVTRNTHALSLPLREEGMTLNWLRVLRTAELA